MKKDFLVIPILLIARLATKKLLSLDVISYSAMNFDRSKIFVDGEFYRLITCFLVSNVNNTEFFLLFPMEKFYFPKRKGNLIFIILLSIVIIDIISLIHSLITSHLECLTFSLLTLSIKIISKSDVGDDMYYFLIKLAFYVQLLQHIFIQYDLDGIIGYFIGCFIFYILYVLPILVQRPIYAAPKFFQIFDD